MNNLDSLVLITLINNSMNNYFLMHFAGTPSQIQKSSNSTVWSGPGNNITGLPSRVIDLPTEKVIMHAKQKIHFFYRFICM